MVNELCKYQNARCNDKKNTFCSSRRSTYGVQFFPACVRVTDELFKRNTGYNMTRLYMTYVNFVFNEGSCANDLFAVQCI